MKKCNTSLIAVVRGDIDVQNNDEEEETIYSLSELPFLRFEVSTADGCLLPPPVFVHTHRHRCALAKGDIPV